MPSLKRFGKRLGIGCLGLVVLLVCFLSFTGPGKDFVNLWRNGTIPALLTSQPKRTYTATNEANLKSLYTAIMLYHDSEGQFPDGAAWMEAIKNRIKAEDMEAKEADKKLVRPDLAGKPDQFGYALNDAAAKKYKDDVPKGTILLYESKQTARNAHGDPKTDRDGYAITVEGTLLQPGK